ncbi:MAG: hypothetical protein HXY28_05680 [Hydrogenophilaceae bacterium]|jgi:uncharacterized protein HemX|nr:hypothetical protein [Hydrogenophilaceae bacterium]
MAEKDQLGWGDDKPVVIQNPGSRGPTMIIGVALVFALALTGFFGYQWTQATTKLAELRDEFSEKEKTLERRVAEQEALRAAETAYATALQRENQLIRDGKAPPPTTVSPMQDWIDRMREENKARRRCLDNPRASGCSRPIPTAAPPVATGQQVFGQSDQ